MQNLTKTVSVAPPSVRAFCYASRALATIARRTNGLYVLVGDSAGNRRPGAQAPRSAFVRGEGMTLTGSFYCSPKGTGR